LAEATPTTSRPWIASVAALGSLAASSLCCLPILPLTLAAGGAGAAWLTASKLQPYLLGLSAACIAYGFWQASRAKNCSVGRKSINFALLALSAILTAGVLLFPQAIANRLAPSVSATTTAQAQPLTSAAQLQDAFNAAPANVIKIVALYSPT
jgi:hypothetical protein